VPTHTISFLSIATLFIELVGRKFDAEVNFIKEL